jgi:hypothetical protein
MIEIGRFPNREFSFFCEFQVAFELQKRGWQVYQPLIDRYIDLIAAKDNEYRTIQVKSSRIENIETLSRDGYESYGLTMKPKDLFHDVRHLFQTPSKFSQKTSIVAYERGMEMGNR